jgi:hypothetical protein
MRSDKVDNKCTGGRLMVGLAAIAMTVLSVLFFKKENE